MQSKQCPHLVREQRSALGYLRLVPKTAAEV